MKTGISKLMAAASVTIMTIASASPAHSQDTFVLNKIPTSYTRGGQTFNGLEGYIINVPNFKQLKFTFPDLIGEPITCTSIHPSTVDVNRRNLRTACTQGSRFTCANLYYSTQYYPGTRDADRMIPNQPVSYWVSRAKVAQPTVDFVGFNLGFYNLFPLAGRSTDQNNWKPVYQETCGRTYGAYKTGLTDTLDTFSNYSDVLRTSQYFGNMIIKRDDYEVVTGIQAVKYNSTGLQGLVERDVVIPGVWVRFAGTNVTSGDAQVPDFVEEKWNSSVARTAIGYNPTNNKMRIVVVQPGRGKNKQDCYYVDDVTTCVKYEPDAGVGATVDDVRNLVGFGTDYPYVLLLDGAGSSQLASSKAFTPGVPTTPGRKDCLRSVATCTSRGDSVANGFVSHLPAGDRLRKNPQDHTQTLVDRPNPTVMLLRY